LFPAKTKDPGPGNYEVEKYWPKHQIGAKFSKSIWESLSAKYVTPGPNKYEPPTHSPWKQYKF